MGFWNTLFGGDRAARMAALEQIRARFAVFHELLDRQNYVLKLISDIEQQSQGGPLEDVAAAREKLAQIQIGTGDIIEKMIELGGDRYVPLRARFEAIRAEIAGAASEHAPVTPDEFIVPFDRLGSERAHSVGGKNANLGEMKSKLALPVPDGFAITTWAYRHFVESNRLNERITKLLKGIRIRDYGDLDVVSEEIREVILSCRVPEDLAGAILGSFDGLLSRSGGGKVALRSSAIGEDTAFTFAGQYVTFLGVERGEVLDRYREVLASKFTPASIYYFMSRSLAESDPAMGVGCMMLVDAAASGVMYSRDPLDPEGPAVLVNAILGLGSYLVEGRLTPDVFRVSRADGTVLESSVARKAARLVLSRDMRTVEQAVPDTEQRRPSISPENLRLLSEYGRRLEEHYGGPQDVEWAVDRGGNLFLLQTRPLRVMRRGAVVPAPDSIRKNLLLGGGTTIYPGAGGGPVIRVETPADLRRVTPGAVMVAKHPAPGLIRALDRASALCTEIGGIASHMATLARESRVPSIAGIAGVTDIAEGTEVTVDATEGRVYSGIHQSLIETRRAETGERGDAAALGAFKKVLSGVAHLNLVNPGDPGFLAENCRTIHDITRFIHQKAMEEMFRVAKSTAHKDRIGRRLKTSIPLVVNVIHLEEDPSEKRATDWIAEDEIESVPMRALWSGVREEGWPERPVPPDIKGFLAVMGTNIQRGNEPEFSENSYAFLSREYMLLNLRMGYHFATIEAFVTSEPSKNYIRMQYKEGGAPLDRRVRRINLIIELLTLMGFESTSRGDFLDAAIQYQSEAAMTRLLNLVGRINIITKQLDMALSNDAVARWYTDDFIKKLGLSKPVA
jgi:pyruvate,water dikinase